MALEGSRLVCLRSRKSISPFNLDQTVIFDSYNSNSNDNKKKIKFTHNFNLLGLVSGT